MSHRQELPELGKITLEGFTLDLDYYLTKPYEDISEASEELPALIEWVNSQLQAVVEQKIISKQRIKGAEARAYFDIRRSGLEELGYAGKETEASVERAVALNNQVSEAYSSFAVLSGWVIRLTNLLISLQSKLDLLRSAEATRRYAGENTQDRTGED